VPPDRQLDRDDVPEHVDPVQLPVNIGKELAHEDDHIAQVLTPVALRARHTADAVEHTVLGEQIDEPLDVQDITLRTVVRAAHERFGAGCHCDLPSGYRLGRVQVHRRDGERPSPESGDCRVLPAPKCRPPDIGGVS
jgi:hypothetical protein